MDEPDEPDEREVSGSELGRWRREIIGGASWGPDLPNLVMSGTKNTEIREARPKTQENQFDHVHGSGLRVT